MSTIPIIRNEEERALLTKLAAHLKGRTLRTHGDDGPFGPIPYLGGGINAADISWNPLADDEDCVRLETEYRVSVYITPFSISASIEIWEGIINEEFPNGKWIKEAIIAEQEDLPGKASPPEDLPTIRRRVVCNCLSKMIDHAKFKSKIKA